MSHKITNLSKMKSNLEQKFTDVYGNNPQNQLVINYIVNELKKGSSSIKTNTLVEEKAQQTQQPLTKQQSTKLQPKEETISQTSIHHGRSHFDQDSMVWGQQAKLNDEKAKLEDELKLKRIREEQENLRAQLHKIQQHKITRKKDEKDDDIKFAEEQKRRIKELEEKSKVKREFIAKNKRDELQQVTKYLEDLKKMERKQRKQQIKEEQKEIAKMMKKINLEDEEQLNKKLKKTLEMQLMIKQNDLELLKQKQLNEDEKAENRGLMKQYSEIIKLQDKRREDEKNNRLEKIDKIANRFQQTVDKDLIAKMKEEAIRIERDQRRENEKFDKEQNRKQKSLERKQQEMVAELEQQRQFKEKAKKQEQDQDKLLGKRIKEKIKEDEKISMIKREQKNKEIMGTAEKLKEQMEQRKKKKKVQQLVDEMVKVSEKQKKEFNKINYKYQRRTKDVINNEKQEKLENKEVNVGLPHLKDKEEVYQDLKKRFRMAWKSPGFKNSEFTKIPTLQGKILNEWEIHRINLAERSYKAPQGFKGFKIPSQYNEFPKPKTPPKYKEGLEEFRLKFDDFVQRPTKYGTVHLDDMLEKVRVNNKEPFRLTNSVQHNEFGFDPHQVWDASLKQQSQKKLQSKTK